VINLIECSKKSQEFFSIPEVYELEKLKFSQARAKSWGGTRNLKENLVSKKYEEKGYVL